MNREKFYEYAATATDDELVARLSILRKAQENYFDLGGSGEDYIGESYASAIHDIEDELAQRKSEKKELQGEVPEDEAVFRLASEHLQEGKFSECAKVVANVIVDRMDLDWVGEPRRSSMGASIATAMAVIFRTYLKEEK